MSAASGTYMKAADRSEVRLCDTWTTKASFWPKLSALSGLVAEQEAKE